MASAVERAGPSGTRCQAVRTLVQLVAPMAPHLADGQLHWKGRAVLALADDEPADADDPPLAGAKIALEIAVMLLAIG